MARERNRSSRINRSNGTSYYTVPILKFQMAVFLALVNLKYLLQHNTESPFEAHRVIMPMFIITILVYTITLSTSYFPEIIGKISLLCGGLAPVLLTLILFPDLGWFIFLIWVIYFVKLIYHACQKLYQMHKEKFSVRDLFNQQLHGSQGQHTDESDSSPASNYRHAILGFPVKVLLALMPLRFQSTNVTPFETHSAIMSIFVLAVLVYAASGSFEAQIQTSNNSDENHVIMIRKISLLSGSLASVLLVFVIVPTVGWFILLVWILFLVKQIYEACHMLHHLYQTVSSVKW